MKAKTLTMEDKYPKPAWLKLTESELKKIIEELSEKYSPAQIGTILRDQYGVPTTKVYGKKLSAYFKEIGKDYNAELKNAEKKLENIRSHVEKNRTDKKAKHKLQKTVSHLNALKKYHAKRKR